MYEDTANFRLLLPLSSYLACCLIKMVLPRLLLRLIKRVYGYLNHNLGHKNLTVSISQISVFMKSLVKD